jgi:uncharacterized membrane-anchored protein YhcB (DUF1043 family)
MRDQPDWTWVGALVGLVIAGVIVGAMLAATCGL